MHHASCSTSLMPGYHAVFEFPVWLSMYRADLSNHSQHRCQCVHAYDAVLDFAELVGCVQGGMELVTEVRQLWPESQVQVVAVTADAFEDRRDQCLSSGFDAWLAKPFRIEDLVRIMAAVSPAPE